MPWNEVSRRYVDDEPEFYFPEYWRQKADNVKQGSSEGEAFNGDLFDKRFREILEKIVDLYEFGIEEDIALEQDRMILPQNMMTEWIWSGTLGAFCDMLVLRLDPHTQLESRIVANKIAALISPIFPISLKARLKN